MTFYYTFERCLANRQFIIVDNNKNALSIHCDRSWKRGVSGEQEFNDRIENNEFGLVFRASSAMSTCFLEMFQLHSLSICMFETKTTISTYPN